MGLVEMRMKKIHLRISPANSRGGRFYILPLSLNCISVSICEWLLNVCYSYNIANPKRQELLGRL
jgi:hypothetical protein